MLLVNRHHSHLKEMFLMFFLSLRCLTGESLFTHLVRIEKLCNTLQNLITAPLGVGAYKS